MELDARMPALRERFRARAGSDGDRIAAALAAGDLDTVRSLAHGLSGSGGVFGFPQVSEDAQAVENAIDAGADAGELAALCHRLLARLTETAQRG
jgi:HPt (histidine-containing phosphotransfer) domain-containing protein